MAGTATSRKPKTPPVTGLHKPATLDHLKKKGRAVEYVHVRLDPEAAAELDEIEAEIGGLEILDQEVYPSLTERRADAQAKVDESTVTIKLLSIGRRAYDALVEKHAPTPEQNAEHRQEQIKQLMADGKTLEEATAQTGDAPYNPDTFPIALISACAVEPELSPADVQGFYEDWNLNEFLQLWMAAVRVHQTSRVGHWGKASG